MPKRPRYGQQITFAIQTDADQTYQTYIWYTVKKGDTIQKIASRRGHPNAARDIADLNGIRSVYSRLSHGRIRLPGHLRQGDTFDVLATTPPKIVDGYPTYTVQDRPGRVGVPLFQGYPPTVMELGIVFENFKAGDGFQIEEDIRLLERMTGRGTFPGAAVGPPPVIVVSTTDGNGALVPLIPTDYQGPHAPTWRIATASGNGIEWGDGAERNAGGNRIRQTATVTLIQHTALTPVRSAAARAQAKVTPKAKK